MFYFKAYVVNCKIWKQFHKLSKCTQRKDAYLQYIQFHVPHSQYITLTLPSWRIWKLPQFSLPQPYLPIIVFISFLPSHLRGRSFFLFLDKTPICTFVPGYWLYWHNLILPFHLFLCFLNLSFINVSSQFVNML